MSAIFGTWRLLFLVVCEAQVFPVTRGRERCFRAADDCPAAVCPSPSARLVHLRGRGGRGLDDALLCCPCPFTACADTALVRTTGAVVPVIFSCPPKGRGGAGGGACITRPDSLQVVPNLRPKSLNAFKSFQPLVNDMAELEDWLQLLAEEIADRVAEDVALNRRHATTVSLGHRGQLNADHLSNWVEGRTGDLTGVHTRTQRVPSGGELTGPRLQAAALELLRKHHPVLPCSRIQLSVGGFVDVPKQTISSFFTSTPAASEPAAVAPQPVVRSSLLPPQPRLQVQPPDPLVQPPAPALQPPEPTLQPLGLDLQALEPTQPLPPWAPEAIPQPRHPKLPSSEPALRPPEAPMQSAEVALQPSQPTLQRSQPESRIPTSQPLDPLLQVPQVHLRPTAACASQTAAASAEALDKDYQMALELQRQFDAEDRAARPAPATKRKATIDRFFVKHPKS